MNDNEQDDYYLGLPSTSEIRDSVQYAYDMWQNRNKYIQAVREMLGGQNKIEAPQNTSYKIAVGHTYSLAAIVNEKAARFTQLPLIQVIPDSEEGESRQRSSQLEKALNVAMSEMERRSDGDVWSRVVLDAIVLDEGVERIERAPAAFWPEVVKLLGDNNPDTPFDDELTTAAIKKYKKSYGIPLRSVYVPLENFLPIYEGPTVVESFEIEIRTLRDVLRNPLFNAAKNDLGQYKPNTATGLRTQVTIIHYENAIWHAYYALVPSNNYQNDSLPWPNLNTLGVTNFGEPIFLHAYKHNLGETEYNLTSGRFGGWKTVNNLIEGVGKGLLELNQGADDLFSQVKTNIRAKYWPTMLQQVDPELRGYNVGGTEPKQLTVPEGQNLVIYKGESVEPLFKPVDDPLVPWLWDKYHDQMGRLGGSSVIFGDRSPGVETGYHQALQITQAEHLDEKIEQHLSVSAVNRATKILKHVKAMDMGEVYVNTTDIMVDGKKTNVYFSLDPNDLSPLPIMDAQVRRPRPVDFAASIRAALEASSEREGKGPLLSDDSIRSDILNQTAPDVEKRKILVENQQKQIIQSGVLTQRIMEQLNIKLAVSTMPGNIDPSKASPIAQEAVRQSNMPQPVNNQAPQPIPGNQGTGSPGPGSLVTGMPAGQAQPEAINGQQLAAQLIAR